MFATPDPLHPALVHLPLGLAIVLPLLALAVAVAIRRDALPVRSWALVLGMHVLLVGGAYVALETGKEQEERVEDVVPKEAIHEHEERAELFLGVSAAALLVTGAGLLASGAGAAARGAAVLVSLVLLGLAVRTGESGGHLVYEHGAAKAYTDKAAPHAHDEGR